VVPIRRIAARARRGLGVNELTSRLDRLAERLDAVERRLGDLAVSRWPHGPLYLGDHQALVATRWGAKMVVDTRDQLLAPWLLLDGLWESHATGWLQKTLRAGDVMVDVGANIGYFTLLAAAIVGPKGKVVAVEAHPDLFALLRRNVVMNGHRSLVTLCNAAAWSKPGRLPFHQRVGYASNSSLASAGPSGLQNLGDTEEVTQVDAVVLDDVLDGLERIDVMKIDVEGAEIQAFRGLSRTLEARPAMKIMFEWSPEQIRLMGDEPGELVDLLAEAGFGYRLLERDLAPIQRSDLVALEYGNVIASR
jgi:FkbM family methyltransferase